MRIKCSAGIHDDFVIEDKVAEAQIAVIGEHAKWQCPACAKEGREEAERAALITALPKIKAESGMPERFFNATVREYEADMPQQQKMVRAVVAYIKNLDENIAKGRCVIMAGSPGTGKTHIACAMLNAAAQSGVSIGYTTVLECARTVKETYGKGVSRFHTEQEAINHYVIPNILVIDEVGIQYQSQAEMIILWEIINRRYNRCVPTILVSNENIDGMKVTLGDRIMDRMREGKGLYLPFQWESHRCK